MRRSPLKFSHSLTDSFTHSLTHTQAANNRIISSNFFPRNTHLLKVYMRRNSTDFFLEWMVQIGVGTNTKELLRLAVLKLGLHHEEGKWATIRTKTTTICSSDKARTQRQMKDCTEVECVSIKNDPKRKIHLLSMKMCVCTCAIFQYNTQFYACIPWGWDGDGGSCNSIINIGCSCNQISTFIYLPIPAIYLCWMNL